MSTLQRLQRSGYVEVPTIQPDPGRIRDGSGPPATITRPGPLPACIPAPAARGPAPASSASGCRVAAVAATPSSWQAGTGSGGGAWKHVAGGVAAGQLPLTGLHRAGPQGGLDARDPCPSYTVGWRPIGATRCLTTSIASSTRRSSWPVNRMTSSLVWKFGYEPTDTSGCDVSSSRITGYK